ncbi:MAG: metalloregulator ArsR/SmtB family transcription factor, partial [Chloroflexota bacterium]
MMTAQEQETLLTLLKVLADESRLTLIRLLNEREYNAGELATELELAEPTVSHHLAKLHGAGLIRLRMAGNQRFYALNVMELNQF